jgi:hypothetical protein
MHAKFWSEKDLGSEGLIILIWILVEICSMGKSVMDIVDSL